MLHVAFGLWRCLLESCLSYNCLNNSLHSKASKIRKTKFHAVSMALKKRMFTAHATSKNTSEIKYTCSCLLSYCLPQVWNFWVHFLGKIKDWSLKYKNRFCVSLLNKGSEESLPRLDSLVPLMQPDLSDPGLICCVKKCKIHFLTWESYPGFSQRDVPFGFDSQTQGWGLPYMG